LSQSEQGVQIHLHAGLRSALSLHPYVAPITGAACCLPHIVRCACKNNQTTYRRCRADGIHV
jgi:hypothetical protein